jgi:hypothetical protein
MRQWAAGTWPYATGGLDDFPKHSIDTGEDDNEVLDTQHK